MERADNRMMALDVLDWRRQVAQIYCEVRSHDTSVVDAHSFWCSARNDLLLNHPASPIPPSRRNSLRTPRYFPYDVSLRFDVAVQAAELAQFRAETLEDGIIPFRRIGKVALGDLGTVDLWWLESYGGGLFLPVKDSHPENYAGGRYLFDTVKGADLGAPQGVSGEQRLIVDLNFAYNPSCAYDSAWSCPLAPSGNVIEHPIAAGELNALQD